MTSFSDIFIQLMDNKTLWITVLVLEGIVILGFLVPKSRQHLISILTHHQLKKYLIPIFRLFIGGMFLFACYHKIKEPIFFAELVTQYQLLPTWSINFFSLWLPMFELLVGLAIIFTKWNQEMSWIVLILMIVFIIAVSQALIRELGIVCGCFDMDGAQSTDQALVTLLRDIAFVPILWWMIWVGKNNFIWDFRDES